jgi:hypothetical protein
MSSANPPTATPASRVLRLLIRAVVIVCMATLIGGTLNHFARSMEHRGAPAGFAQGMLQGAMMPCAMPNLLLGRDVTIYALNNTGVSYKLGYTVGVNACGALFFGIFFYRIRRLMESRRKLNA